jgi:hypothetical protein
VPSRQLQGQLQKKRSVDIGNYITNKSLNRLPIGPVNNSDIIIIIIIIIINNSWLSRLCGLVVRVPGDRPRGTGLIPGATRFSGK